MATITSAQSGDFSDTATWVGGVVPTVGDIAVAANGHVVAIDTDVTLTKVTQLGTGKFTLGGGRTLTAEVEAVSGSFTSGGTVEVTATSGSTAYIIGNVTGLSSTGVNICGVNVKGTGTLELTGNVTGTAGNASSEANGHAGVYSNVVCTINITGNVIGGSGSHKRGVQLGVNSVASNIMVLGNTTGGSGVQAYGMFIAGASTAFTIIGNTTGGTTNDAHGTFISGGSSTIYITGNVTGGSGGLGSFGAVGMLSTGASSIINITGTVSGNILVGMWVAGVGSSVSIIGNLLGGNNTNCFAIRVSGASISISITGNVTGGGGATAYGISATGASATINVVGDVSGGGGPGTSAHGIYATDASSIIDVTGTLTGTNNSSAGVRSDATTGYVIFGGNLIDSPAGATALYAIRARIRSTGVSGYNQYSTTDGFTTGSQVQRVSTDIVTGMPANRDVRLSTLYGYNNELTGTMIVPPTSSVLTGVLVDNSTGSLVFDSKEQIADAVLHLLAGITETGSVVTIPFYSGSKDYSRTTIVDGTRTKTFTPIEE
jgi:hypothetical protein